MTAMKQQFISKLQKVLGADSSTFALHEPCFAGNEWTMVKDCLDSGWVSSVGKYVDEFEKRLAEFTGAAYAIAVVNGTAALHLSLLLAGVKRDDEVLIPSLSFVATANAVAYCGAIPHFIDCDQKTLGLDPAKLKTYIQEHLAKKGGSLYNPKTGRRIQALVPMHTFGHPVDLAALTEIAAEYHLTMIEDAAESLGSYYQSQHTGTFGKLGILSFNGNKIISTGGGGAILTNDPFLAKEAKHLSTTGKKMHPWEFHHDRLAYNYRLPNINAALGCAQMEQLPQFLKNKRNLALSYIDAFAEDSHLFSCVTEPKDCVSNYWLNAIILKEASMREELLKATNEAGYQCRPVWQLLHTLPMYQDCPRADLSTSESLAQSLINIPSGAKLANASAS